MNWLDFFNHIGNLLLPALGVSVLMTLLALLSHREWRSKTSWVRLLTVNFCAGAVVLLAGLFVTGGDGRMETYAAMVLAIGFCHALFTRR